MKKFYALFLVLVLGSLLAACSASTANITSSEIGTGFDTASNKATGVATTFDKGVPEIHIVTAVANAPDGTTLRTVLTAMDVTDVNGNNIKNTKVNEATKTLSSDSAVNVTFSAPTSGWPTGAYSSTIYLNDTLDRTLTFTVK
jgi:hypothetical protein